MKNPFKKEAIDDPAMEEIKPVMKQFYDSLERYLTSGKGCLTAKEHYRRLRGYGLSAEEILDSDDKQMRTILEAVCIKMMPKKHDFQDALFLAKMGADITVGAMISDLFGNNEFLKKAVIDVLDSLMVTDCVDCDRGSY